MSSDHNMILMFQNNYRFIHILVEKKKKIGELKILVFWIQRTPPEFNLSIDNNIFLK